MSNVWTISPRETDPLGWFTRPVIPLVFAVVTLIFGVVSVVGSWQQLREPWLDIIAIALASGACLLVHVWARPLRGQFDSRHGATVVAIASLAILFAAFSARESEVLVQHWWGPIGAGLVVGSLAPYSSVRQLVPYVAAIATATAAGAYIAFTHPGGPWPPLSAGVIAVSGILVAGVAATTFSFVIVSTTQSLLESPNAELSDEPSPTEAASQAERRTLARLGTRVAPFLEGIADTGVVTESDRALAGQLARRLRADLVSQANRSWLDSLALSGPIYVVDPDRRADRLNTVQRAALRGLLLAVMKNPATHDGSLFIELRGQDDGSTAVALSLDVDLPEGRRTMMLAPYYLTRQTDVRGLTWDPSRELLKFQFPAQRE